MPVDVFVVNFLGKEAFGLIAKLLLFEYVE